MRLIVLLRDVWYRYHILLRCHNRRLLLLLNRAGFRVGSRHLHLIILADGRLDDEVAGNRFCLCDGSGRFEEDV